jgi:hypothetical protein
MEQNIMRVALPYYGKLVDPRQGLSPLFFIADIDPTTGEIVQLQLESRSRESQQTFTGWLICQDISGVLSTDQPDYCLASFAEHGLWHQVVAGQEPVEQINDWLETCNPLGIQSKTAATKC